VRKRLGISQAAEGVSDGPGISLRGALDVEREFDPRPRLLHQVLPFLGRHVPQLLLHAAQVFHHRRVCLKLLKLHWSSSAPPFH
jgi:hypothetical protein